MEPDNEPENDDFAALELHYETNQLEKEAKIGISLKGKHEKNLFIQIDREDDAWSSGKIEFNEESWIVSTFFHVESRNAINSDAKKI